jgi:S-adenosylmethionine hydrolase
VIILFSDFGAAGPYVGQMRAVLARQAPGVPVIELMADAPARDPRASAYLLAAYCREFPSGSVFLAVVDPGVGGGRDALALEISGRWFVGPDNGLLALVARRAEAARWWRITWRPEALSASFHGRDLFAPVAARLALGESPPGEPLDGFRPVGGDWPDDLPEIVYLDHFGNAMTGLRAATLSADDRLGIGGRELRRARVFSDVPEGAAFWYENANGLAEVAVNGGRAAAELGLEIGMKVKVI